ncbi:Tetratricopeptide repeat protein 39B [Microtus ochrogaster]|uniref:Tetratricopeptide repeat protein 39B n=1 Tax=Microtus ochrogaster TaxID=79684 RepID=A0A8J6H1N8_MICOH|nr:Tetratricopeptide repeat protein 39B [Microtus ochrogaster]
MATSGFHFVPCDTKRASRQLGASAVGSSSTKVDLKSGLEECAEALNLFLSNKFKDALELLRPWAKESMYHALGYSTIVVLQAIMTFEQQDIQNGISAMKDALQTCQKYRKKCTVVESFSSLLSRGSLEQLSEEEMHAEICYAECLLQKAALTFVQDLGLLQLREGALGSSMRSPLCCLTILAFHTYISLILGTGEVNVVEAESLLAPFLQQFPNGSLILFYHARIELLNGNAEKATYVFLKAAILSMLPEEEVAVTNENVVALFRQVDGLKQRIAGKSLPTEKFAVRKARRYSPSSGAPGKLVLPALEMMYVWNGFSIVAKRKDLSENLLVTVEKAEAALQTQNSADSVDDECLVKLLKGCCLKNLERPLQAELCFNHIVESEKLLKYDHYLVPFTLFELACLYKSQGDIDKAIKTLETASCAVWSRSVHHSGYLEMLCVHLAGQVQLMLFHCKWPGSRYFGLRANLLTFTLECGVPVSTAKLAYSHSALLVPGILVLPTPTSPLKSVPVTRDVGAQLTYLEEADEEETWGRSSVGQRKTHMGQMQAFVS